VIEKSFFHIDSLELMLIPDMRQHGLACDQIIHILRPYKCIYKLYDFNANKAIHSLPINDRHKITASVITGLLAISRQKNYYRIPGTIK
jgi:hypothetical protein